MSFKKSGMILLKDNYNWYNTVFCKYVIHLCYSYIYGFPKFQVSIWMSHNCLKN